MVEIKEANNNRIEKEVAEATKVGDKMISSVLNVARKATLQRIALTRRAMMMIRNLLDAGKQHWPGRLKKKRKKKRLSRCSSKGGNSKSILCQWVTESMLQLPRYPKLLEA